MTTVDPDARQRALEEERQLSARGMRLLTGGLTEEGDAFLIGVAAVMLFACLYPLVDAWALVAFPTVLVAAVLIRARVRRRRR